MVGMRDHGRIKDPVGCDLQTNHKVNEELGSFLQTYMDMTLLISDFGEDSVKHSTSLCQ